MFLVER